MDPTVFFGEFQRLFLCGWRGTLQIQGWGLQQWNVEWNSHLSPGPYDDWILRSLTSYLQWISRTKVSLLSLFHDHPSSFQEFWCLVFLPLVYQVRLLVVCTVLDFSKRHITEPAHCWCLNTEDILAAYEVWNAKTSLPVDAKNKVSQSYLYLLFVYEQWHIYIQAFLSFFH